MDINVEEILDFIYRNLLFSLIIAVFLIIIVALIIYRLMHYNISSNKSSYRMRHEEIKQKQIEEIEKNKNQQSHDGKKNEIIKCKFCGGEITDSTALHCPLCGTTL